MNRNFLAAKNKPSTSCSLPEKSFSAHKSQKVSSSSRDAGKNIPHGPQKSASPPDHSDLAAQLPQPPTSLWRVQVKCSTQILNGLYRINAHRRINGRAVPYLPSEIDFFAAYIIPEDTWYIVPLLATRRCTSLLFCRKSDPRPGLYDPYLEAWPYSTQGTCQNDEERGGESCALSKSKLKSVLRN